MSDQQDYREIPLTKGQVALVSAEDYERINAHNWYATWSKTTGTYYAHRKTSKKHGPPRTIQMHREVMGLTFGDRREIDHREPKQTLDNRRQNLRFATHSQNSMNQKMFSTNTSGRKGVHKNGSTGKWQVRVNVGGKRKYLGEFTEFEKACAVRDAAEKEHYGEFARAS